MAKDPSLDAAYALNGTDDVRDLYQAWADSYDTGFAAGQGYQLPQLVAQAYVDAGGAGPVLDVGAGTGLVGQELARHGIGPIDAVDLSADMLRVARCKGIYRNLIEADINAPLPVDDPYAGIVSAGTFTLGHVGPDGIITLLDWAAPGTLFVISVNARHYVSAGFAGVMAELSSELTDQGIHDVPIYDPARCDPDHRADTARLLIFRKG